MRGSPVCFGLPRSVLWLTQTGGIHMFAWIMENIATIIISTVLLIAVAAIIVRMVRNKKKGKSSCGCGCAGCAMNGSCHPQK